MTGFVKKGLMHFSSLRKRNSTCGWSTWNFVDRVTWPYFLSKVMASLFKVQNCIRNPFENHKWFMINAIIVAHLICLTCRRRSRRNSSSAMNPLQIKDHSNTRCHDCFGVSHYPLHTHVLSHKLPTYVLIMWSTYAAIVHTRNTCHKLPFVFISS